MLFLFFVNGPELSESPAKLINRDSGFVFSGQYVTPKNVLILLGANAQSLAICLHAPSSFQYLQEPVLPFFCNLLTSPVKPSSCLLKPSTCCVKPFTCLVNRSAAALLLSASCLVLSYMLAKFA